MTNPKTRPWSKLLFTFAVISMLAFAVACGGSDDKTPSSSSSSSSSSSGSTTSTGGDTALINGYPACASGAASDLTGAGATFPFPLYSKWIDQYEKACKVKINYQSVGSGAGIAQITAKTVDFGASDGILTDAQEQAAVAAGGPIQHIPMTSGAIAVIYNLPGVASGALKLDGPALADIYLGNIKKWDDAKIKALNSGVSLPSADIAVVRRSDGSGTSFIFTNYLSKVSKDWETRVGFATAVNWPGGIGGQGNEGVAGQVRQLPGAIGYVELAYAKQNNIPWAQIKNKAGNFVQPTLEGTTAAATGITLPDDMKVLITDSTNDKAYPISGFTWVLAYENQPNAAKGKALASYLWWAIHEGQKQGEALNYAALSPDAVKHAEGLVLSLKCGGAPCLAK
jgi:phosphate transport system substrate-binding protein